MFSILVPSLGTPYQQQDAHEALVYVLDLLHGSLNRNYSNTYVEQSPSRSSEALKLHRRREDSFIWDLFGGQLQSEVLCPNCNKKSVNFDHFTSLSLEIMKDLESPIPLEAVLQSFTHGENIEWKCPACNRKVNKPKRVFTISLLPNILILHLKRFSQCYLTGEQQKIEKLVHFPIDGLDMVDYISNYKEQNPVTKYNLYATLNQKGSLGSGHYTANIKRYKKWYLCNDLGISPGNFVPDNQNYVLFYVRNDVNFETK